MLRNTIDFMLYEWLRVDALSGQGRYADHSRETFSAVLDTAERIATEKFAPFNRTVDTEEPRLVDDRVVQPRCAHEAAAAFVESGMLSASQDYEMGGMQLPCVVEMAAHVFFAKASIGLHGGHMLTTANANLLLAHGTARQRDVFARRELSGEWFGTMCLSEPQAGSGLSEILTRAVPDGVDHEMDPLGPRYRLTGNKMWISNGDHELASNIVHLVLAKIPGPDGRLPPGVRGISLFIVPKHLVDGNGDMTGERNDIAVAGLNHKLGHRGVPNTLLNFGEGRYRVRGTAGAVGYLVGLPGEGLKCMFHMMNEARIVIGLYAASIGYAGFQSSFEYSRTRLQGRRMTAGGKDSAAPPVPIIAHADVRRMLLAQKAYAEGGLALGLYCARLVDEVRVGQGAPAEEAGRLLELLTPVAKSWASEWCVEANSLAIQVLGGYGYTRDYPVELFWRDNRLNMIHEGTHGIQALDLLSRKVRIDGGSALALLERRVRATVRAGLGAPTTASMARALQASLDKLLRTTAAAWVDGDPELATANATPYLQGFGHVVVAWLWLEMAIAATRSAGQATEEHGKMRAARYFFQYELPKVDAWLRVVADRDRTCLEAAETCFLQ
jgi:alkylation response protein AidB-like acyl-CoA dehydrogenase